MEPSKPRPDAWTRPVQTDLPDLNGVAPGPKTAFSRDRLNVALVSEYYYPDVGGMPEHVHHLGKTLCDRGHRVTVVTTVFPGQVDAPAVPYQIVRLGRACPPLLLNGSVCRAAVGLSLRASLRRLFARERFSVIHLHAPIFPTLSLLAIANAPPETALVGTLHTHLTESRGLRLFRAPLQRYLDALDDVIAVSDTAAESLGRLGFRVNAEIIPNGVDLASWQAGRRDLQLRQDASFCLLAQARLEPRNRVETVVSALRVRQLEGRPARLWVLGEGPCRQKLQQRAAGLDVNFFGRVVEARKHFAASADAFCFTADLASFPMSLIEGMAAGLPVIAHPIPGVRELVTHRENGLLVPVGDVQAYAQAVGALQDNETLRRDLGQAAQRRVAALDWSHIAARIEKRYERAMGNRNGHPGHGVS